MPPNVDTAIVLSCLAVSSPTNILETTMKTGQECSLSTDTNKLKGTIHIDYNDYEYKVMYVNTDT